MDMMLKNKRKQSRTKKILTLSRPLLLISDTFNGNILLRDVLLPVLLQICAKDTIKFGEVEGSYEWSPHA